MENKICIVGLLNIGTQNPPGKRQGILTNWLHSKEKRDFNCHGIALTNYADMDYFVTNPGHAILRWIFLFAAQCEKIYQT